MDLCKEDVLRLIGEYEKRPILWSTKNKWHYNKTKKIEAWEEVAKELGVEVEDAKKKVASLLGSFRREKSKGKKFISTGEGIKKAYKSDWFAFKSFEFLMDKNDSKETDETKQKSLNYTLFYNENSDTFDARCIEHSPVQNFVKSQPIVENVNEDSTRTLLELPVFKRRKLNGDTFQGDKDASNVQRMLDFQQKQMGRDDSTMIFSKYLAEKLNQFDARTKSILIYKINQLVFEAEIGNMYTISQLSPELSPLHIATPSPAYETYSPTRSQNGEGEFKNVPQ